MTEQAENETSSSTVIRSLLNTIRELHAKGIECTYTMLKKACPGHSSRDYADACKQFREEQGKIAEWSSSAPPIVDELAKNLAVTAWASASEYYAEKLRQEKLVHNLELDEVRTARKQDEEDKLVLEAELEKFRQTTAALQDDNTALRMEVERLKDELRNHKVANEKLQASNEQFKATNATLNEAVNTLRKSVTMLRAGKTGKEDKKA